MKNKKSVFLLVLCTLVMITSSGCSSIITGGTKDITVKSNPTGAKVEVYNWKEEHVETRTAPFTTSVKRGSGYFKPAKYEFKASMEGRPVRVVGFKSGINGWYWGNILFGGLIGMLIVDPLTGAMWEPPEEIMINLSESQPSSSKAWHNETVLHDERECSVALAHRISLKE